MAELVSYQATCHGRVQGVFYRASTVKVANKLGVKGWVKNQADGTVLLHAEGQNEAVQQLLEWCKKGPLYAHVTQVEVSEANLEGFSDFSIKYG